MKSYLKIISGLLAVVMLLSVFVSCKDQGGEDQTGETGGTEESTAKDEYHPEIEKKDLDSEFYLWIMPDSNPVDNYWVKESQNNTLSDAIYDRQEKVRKYLGVEIIGTETEILEGFVTPFKNAVKNKDNSVHMLISHVYYGIDGFITGNFLLDFNDIPELSLEEDYWRQDVMGDLAVNDNLYLGFNDFNILYTHVLVYDKEMLEKYQDTLDESVYDMVINYHWTLDEMISLASLAYTDANADGKTEDDTFGIAGYQSVPFIGFMHASNIQLVDVNEKGAYVVSCYNETNKQKMSDLVDKLYDLTRADYAWLKSPAPKSLLAEGRTLMEIAGTIWLDGYLNHDIEFGILPFPMYDEYQKDVGYRSLQWGGYLCIPSYLENPQMVGETVEMMAYFSDDVNTAYYEKMLGKQVADAPLDKKMLDIVWDSVCSDFGQTFFTVVYNSKLLYMLPDLTVEGTKLNLASYMAGIETSANKKLKKFIAEAK